LPNNNNQGHVSWISNMQCGSEFRRVFDRHTGPNNASMAKI